MKAHIRLSTILTVGFLAVGGCSRKVEALAPAQRDAIQTRVMNVFEYTLLFKPPELQTNSPLALKLSPLIIQEVADTNATSLWRDQFGTSITDPVVSCESGVVNFNGRAHDQLSYSWTYTAADSSAAKSQGIRITLNAAGEPVIWEVLHDSSGVDILYVAQSLELAARAEFGAPLPGRKFAIESSLVDAPNTVVANVIDDGPTPMGPVVYLMKKTRDVSTITCRCMASQGGTLLEQTNYKLIPATDASARFPQDGGIERRLRLPNSF